jgi:hypothetical protein
VTLVSRIQTFAGITPGLEKHRDRGSSDVMKMQVGDPGGLARIFPLAGEISLLERKARLGCKDDSGPSWRNIQRSLQGLRAWDSY